MEYKDIPEANLEEIQEETLERIPSTSSKRTFGTIPNEIYGEYLGEFPKRAPV